MPQVRYFAAAAEAAGVASETLDAPTLGALRARLVDAHGAGFERVLARCSVLVDGVHTEDPTTPLTHAALVDVLPPFAGG
ncbi:MoaD/ThiS family protein [Propioniciclava soli]|uniref:MoaD/ThiS family protein n=1 Tax=Propioniciclava soli TaxID=2775081 RepID=A0ABZ3CBM3_9ACTN